MTDVQLAGTVVRGRRDGDVASYRGIPYAMPPTRRLRWRDPVPIEPSGAVLDATEFGPSAPQPATPNTEGAGRTSEACLTLNVWTPEPSGRALPVLVWIHGGGFKAGSSAQPVYDGSRLATAGMVVVTVNYRLGALGFGHLVRLGPGFEEATNLGLKDVVAALRWVRGHIAAFGGDPDRVTVAGVSSGAYLSGALLGSSAAAGLFGQLLMMSGGPFKILPADRAAMHADRLVDALGLQPDEINRDRLERLPPEAFFAAVNTVYASDVGRRNAADIDGLAVVDDHGLTTGALGGHPSTMMREAAAHGVRLCFTTTRHETALWRRLGGAHFATPRSRDVLVDEVAGWGVPVGRATAIVDRYLESAALTAGDADLAGAREALLTDWIFTLPVAQAARRYADLGGRVWTAQLRIPGRDRTAHFDEIAALFGTAPSDLELSEARFGVVLRDAVRRFVCDGSPGWTRHTDRAVVGFLEDGVTEVDDAYGRLHDLWAGVVRS